jgi:hypothetical protein
MACLEGHHIFAINVNPDFVKKAIDYNRIRNQHKSNKKNIIPDVENFDIFDLFNEKLEMLRTQNVSSLTNYSLFDGIACFNTITEIKAIIYECFRKKTKGKLLQAYLIYQFSSTAKWKDWFANHGITNTLNCLAKLFDISLSHCKQLNQIGKNIFLYHDKFKEHSIDITEPRLMEKLRYLHIAFKNHKDDELIIVNNFLNMPAKIFRVFAKDPLYNAGKEPLRKAVYKKAVELQRQYEKLKSKYEQVELFNLSSENDINQLRTLLVCLESDRTNFERWYPGLWPFSVDNYYREIIERPMIIPSSSFSEFMDC